MIDLYKYCASFIGDNYKRYKNNQNFKKSLKMLKLRELEMIYNAASVIIQSCWKSYIARKKFKLY